MQEALELVIVGVVVVSAIVAVFTLGAGRGAYDHIGEGDLTFDREAGHSSGSGSDPFRDDEIRQLLTARNARRAARGDAPVDVEAELAALTRPVVDDALRSEIRSLVQARNARRIARGKPPLDVEAEVERRLSDPDG